MVRRPFFSALLRRDGGRPLPPVHPTSEIVFGICMKSISCRRPLPTVPRTPSPFVPFSLDGGTSLWCSEYNRGGAEGVEREEGLWEGREASTGIGSPSSVLPSSPGPRPPCRGPPRYRRSWQEGLEECVPALSRAALSIPVRRMGSIVVGNRLLHHPRGGREAPVVPPPPTTAGSAPVTRVMASASSSSSPPPSPSSSASPASPPRTSSSSSSSPPSGPSIVTVKDPFMCTTLSGVPLSVVDLHREQLRVALAACCAAERRKAERRRRRTGGRGGGGEMGEHDGSVSRTETATLASTVSSSSRSTISHSPGKERREEAELKSCSSSVEMSSSTSTSASGAVDPADKESRSSSSRDNSTTRPIAREAGGVASSSATAAGAAPLSTSSASSSTSFSASSPTSSTFTHIAPAWVNNKRAKFWTMHLYTSADDEDLCGTSLVDHPSEHSPGLRIRTEPEQRREATGPIPGEEAHVLSKEEATIPAKEKEEEGEKPSADGGVGSTTTATTTSSSVSGMAEEHGTVPSSSSTHHHHHTGEGKETSATGEALGSRACLSTTAVSSVQSRSFMKGEATMEWMAVPGAGGGPTASTLPPPVPVVSTDPPRGQGGGGTRKRRVPLSVLYHNKYKREVAKALTAALNEDTELGQVLLAHLSADSRRLLLVMGTASEFYGEDYQQMVDQVLLADRDKDRAISATEYREWAERSISTRLQKVAAAAAVVAGGAGVPPASASPLSMPAGSTPTVEGGKASLNIHSSSSSTNSRSPRTRSSTCAIGDETGGEQGRPGRETMPIQGRDGRVGVARSGLITTTTTTPGTLPSGGDLSRPAPTINAPRVMTSTTSSPLPSSTPPYFTLQAADGTPLSTFPFSTVVPPPSSSSTSPLPPLSPGAAKASTSPTGSSSSAPLSTAPTTTSSSSTLVLPRSIYGRLLLTAGLPFLAFGLLDNTIFILAGDAIDRSLSMLFGFSSLAAAGFGGVVSGVAGIQVHGLAERWIGKVAPEPPLTPAQRQSDAYEETYRHGSTIGMVVGLLLGMTPLMLLNTGGAGSGGEEDGGSGNPLEVPDCF